MNSWCFLLYIFSLTSSVNLLCGAIYPPIQEMLALESFYNSAGGPYWTWSPDYYENGLKWTFATISPIDVNNMSSLFVSNPCAAKWQGLVCSCNRTTQQNENIVYYYDDNGYVLPTPPPASPCHIEKILLTAFNLSGNSANWTAFSQFQKLRAVHLGKNSLGGKLTLGETFDLPSLSIFDVGDNFLSGAIPIVLFTKNDNLTVLNLEKNKFSSIHSLTTTTKPYLKNVFISQNQLVGRLPNFTFETMQIFAADNNLFTSTLPQSYLNSKSLRALYLNNNFLSKWLPDISFLTNLHQPLQVLQLSNNKFTGNLPLNLGNLQSLVVLSVANNSFNGILPIAARSFPRLQWLDGLLDK